MLEQALQKARQARLFILDKMNATISKHRDQLSEFAPRIITIKINPSKIGEVIGPGGKIIRGIVEETGAKVDIEDDGTVLISSVEAAAGIKAREIIESIVEEPEIGKVYPGVVRRVAPFGVFVEILPGTDGLVHVSELGNGHIRKVEDAYRIGDRFDVKVINIDNEGKVRLSQKVLMDNSQEGRQRPERSERTRR